MTLENSIGIRSFLLCIYTNHQENNLLRFSIPVSLFEIKHEYISI
jgi:hypothetical protein